jgi:nucleoside-diphosphate-sugar epimerase
VKGVKDVKVAVAGGRGFIGSHLCSALTAAGAEVSAFGSGGLAKASPATVLVWAAGNAKGSEAELEQVHSVAAVEAAESIGAGHVVYLSSGEVYGQSPVPWLESSTPQPQTAYGRAKIAGEKALGASCARRDVRLTIVRPAVVYGPGQSTGMLIPSALSALLAGESFDTTEGTQTRDFVHVRDVALLITAAIQQGAAGILHAASGEERPVRDMLSSLAAAVGSEAVEQLRFGARPMRTGEASRYAMSVKRAGDELGWAPSVSLEAGFAELVALSRA